MASIKFEKISVFLLFLSHFEISSSRASSEAIYEFVDLFEYSDFSSTWPFTFRVSEGVSLANWYFQATSSHPASCEKRNVTIHLQHGSLPVINPLGSKFPDSFYIAGSQHKTLYVITDNHTLSTSLRNPQAGHWYGVAYLQKTGKQKILPADLFVDCKYKLRSWFTTELAPNIDTVALGKTVDIELAADEAKLYKFFVPLNALAHTVTVSNCAVVANDNTTSCPLAILSKGQSIPGNKNSTNIANCSVSAVDDTCELSNSNPVVNDWTYLLMKSETQAKMTFSMKVKVTEIPILPKPVTDQETETQTDYQLLPLLDRFSYNSMYKNWFAYTVGGTVQDVAATVTGNQTTVVPFKLEQDGDTGGSLAVKVKLEELVSTKTKIGPVVVEFCVMKKMLPFVKSKECKDGFLGNTSSEGQRSQKVILPYPSPETYFVGLKMKCYDPQVPKNQSAKEVRCESITAKVFVNVTTDSCVEGKCNDHGRCHNYLNGQVLFSTCKCSAGWRGYDCSDGKESREEGEQLLELLLLTLTNLLFIPAIVLSLYRRHFVEALVYTYTMTFSGLYHACDGNRTPEFKYCALRLGIMSIADFLGSALCIWVTLVAMARPPEKLKAVLQMAGPLGLIFGILYKKTSAFLFIAPAGLGLLMIFISWVCRCCYRHKCYPTIRKYLLCLLPGVLLAVGGICIFTFVETEDNYLYVHSGWHACMSLCIVFLLPPRERKGDYKVRQTNSINLGSTYQPIRPAEDNYVI